MSSSKKNFAQKFAKELEEHLAYGEKLAKSLSNPNISNVQTTPVEQNSNQKVLYTYAGSAITPDKEDEQPSFTARVRDYIQNQGSKKGQEDDLAQNSDYRSPERRGITAIMSSLGKDMSYNTNNEQEDSNQHIEEIDTRQFNTVSSKPTYSSNESRLPLSLPKRIQQAPVDNRNSHENVSQGLEARRSESAHLEDERRMSLNDSRRSGDAGIEQSSYLFPNMEKKISFKKKIISDSMQRLKNSIHNSGAPTRENSLKSGMFPELEQLQAQNDAKKQENELALRQLLANTSLTYENGDAKSSEDSFHMRDYIENRASSMSVKKVDSILEKYQPGRDQPLSDEHRGRTDDSRGIVPRGVGYKPEESEGTMIQLKELFRNSNNDANASRFSAKVGSYPNTGRSPRDSYTVSQLFRPSETTESCVMNVSRLGELDDPAEIQERIEELRRYSMELGIPGYNGDQISDVQGPAKEAVYGRRHQSDIGESSSANEQENTHYMSSNTMEGMKSLRTPDFQSYTSHMKDNHFFALHNQNNLQDNARNGGDVRGTQNRTGGPQGTKMSIIKRFSEELERGLANKLPMPQMRPMDPQESSEYPESQEMMGFLSFSKEHGRTDASETLQSPDKYEYDTPAQYGREKQGRTQANVRRVFQEEDKEREQVNRALESHLEETASKVNIKTFLALRSILKPHRAIVLCCEGLLKLLAGFEDIPQELEEQEGIEWNQIKTLFNSPVKFVNLVSSFKNIVNKGELTPQKIEAVELVLSRIQVHLDTPQHEAFNQLHDFLVAVVKYYESRFQDNYYNLRRDTFEEPEKVAPVPVQKTEAPRNRPNLPPARNYKPNPVPVAKKSPIQSRYSPNNYSSKKVEPNKVQQRNAKSAVRTGHRSPVDVMQRENQPRMAKNSQSITRQEQGRSTQQARSASRTPTRKNVSSKIDNRRVVLGQKPLENNYMNDREEIYHEEGDEGVFRDGVRFLVDVEQSEAGELKDTIETKEKEAREYRNKVKKMLFEHDRFVKKFLKQQENLEEEINREFAIEDWMKTNEMKQQQNEFERDIKHQKNMDYINEKKEVKEMKDREDKENMNEELLEALQDHYYHAFKVQTQKESKKKDLREKYKSVLADKISKKQKETMESISQKEELAQKRKDHYKSKKIDIENEKNKWQGDYIMLSKLIGNAK